MEVISKPNELIVVICCYSPPNSTPSTTASLVEYISNILSRYPTNDCIILGDLNLPEIDWDTLTANSEAGKSICDCFFKFNIHQIIREPTHIKGNVLDIVATNNPQLLSNIHIDSTSQRSDHYLISFYITNISLATPTNPRKKRIWLYNKTAQNQIPKLQRMNQADSPNVNASWSNLKTTLQQIRAAFVPSITISQQSPKWFNAQIRHKLNCVRTIRRQTKKHTTPTNQLKLARKEAELQSIMELTKQTYEQNLVATFQQTPQRLHSYIRHLSTNATAPTKIYPLNSNAITNTSLETAEAFNNYFHSIYTSSDYTLPDTDLLPSPSHQLHTIEIQSTDVESAINGLSSSKAHGCDDIGPSLITLCAKPLLESLTSLFQQCLTSSEIPDEWKTHKIIPIYKKGDRSQVSNYRPISLLCTTSNILERIIYNKIIYFIRHLLSPLQYGFLANRSCLQNLLSTYSAISSSLDKSNPTDVVYLDFSKAFDTLPHNELLFKLWSFGITGPLWLWFKNYLSNRKQFVQMADVTSSYLPVVSGVPQGSVLGPLLFLIYINDLPKVITHSNIRMFADDTKLMLDVIKSSPSLLQIDLHAVYEWCDKWKLKLNLNKCQLIRFSNSQSNNIPPYQINNHPIPNSRMYCDLGIHINDSLTFDDHYKSICSKAYRSLYLIRRTLHLHNAPMQVKKQLYLSIIRSHLTYCSQIWHPHQFKYITMLENVQRRCTKYITNDYTSDYKSRLQQINLLPLMYWYDLLDLLFFVKCLKTPPDNFSITDHVQFISSSTRNGYNHKLQFKYTRTSASRHFYFNRIVRLWNAMPTINTELPFDSIKSFMISTMRAKFINTFDPSNTCTFHFVCPCSNCHLIPL